MKICVVTATRAEYGLLSGLMRLIDDSTAFELQVVVAGTHLLEDFGHTVRDIVTEGFSVSRTVDSITQASTGFDVASQVGAGITGFANAFTELDPDFVVVLGDRYEMFAATQAAFFLGIRILHIHGGEVTHGALDDSIRHAISKLASFHCVAHEEYASRVIQLGEQPESVHIVGSLGIDQLHNTALQTRQELEVDLDLDMKEPVLLVTYHPVTNGHSDARNEALELVAALEGMENATIILTMPNADPGHQFISEIFRAAADHNGPGWVFRESLGRVRYWSVMSLAAVVVGNSSSGLLEAPSFPTATVNIGPRQSGRIVADSVVSCEPSKDSITQALEQALSGPFQQDLRSVENPLGGPGAAKRIFSVMESLSESSLERKIFYDLGREK